MFFDDFPDIAESPKSFFLISFDPVRIGDAEMYMFLDGEGPGQLSFRVITYGDQVVELLAFKHLISFGSIFGNVDIIFCHDMDRKWVEAAVLKAGAEKKGATIGIIIQVTLGHLATA